jgi:uncharacterized FAD-dependent dehydrogenase
MPNEILRLHSVRVPFGAPGDAVARAAAAIVGVEPAELTGFKIVRRSLDTRGAPRIFHVYAVEFAGPADLIAKLPPNEAAVVAPVSAEPPPPGAEGLPAPPVIIGAGPAGLFAALILAENGYAPVIIERGKAVGERGVDVSRLMRGEGVAGESNLLFGAGGAGAYSDGKLNTRINEPHVRRMLETLVECGAPESILIDARPHIGSDALPGVVAAMRGLVERLGGSFRFGAKVDRLSLDGDGNVAGVELSGGETVAAGAVIVAPGNWADDLIEALHAQGVAMEAKPFQIGVRIEHPQATIDRAVYRLERGELPPAEYITSVRGRGAARGVASFCMCPGGMIVPAVTSEGRLSTNGASNAARSGRFANAALVVTVDSADVGGEGPLAGLAFQRSLEEAAFAVGGDFRAPAQGAADFLSGRVSERVGDCSYPFGVVAADLGTLLPSFLVASLKTALPAFDRKLAGFVKEGLLVAVEARATSAVRIVRDGESRESVSTPGLYPAGEGSGYAGGITSSAVDGMRTAEAVIRRFARCVITR